MSFQNPTSFPLRIINKAIRRYDSEKYLSLRVAWTSYKDYKNMEELYSSYR